MIELVTDTDNHADERKGLPSASGMERVVLCPGSLAAEAGAPEEPESEWAAEGTLIHAVLAGEKPESDLTDDQLWVVTRCREIEAEIIESVGLDFIEEPIIERRYWHSAGTYSGKPDKVLIARDRFALICDYKSGRGNVAPAERNFQMRALAVLVAREHKLKSVFVALVHPRHPHAKATLARYDAEDLATAEWELTNAIVRALEPGAPRIPGTQQCHYCKAKAQCPEARGGVERVAAVTLAPPDIVLPVLDGDGFADVLPQVELAEQICKAIKTAAKEYIAAGNEIPGWYLTEGRKTPKIGDANAAYAKLAHLAEPDEFAACCTVGLTKVKALVGAKLALKGKALDARVEELLGEVITKERSAGSLARSNETGRLAA